jgi:hypothetical protein
MKHLVITLLCAFSSLLSAQTLSPYLQGVTPNSIWITWKTSSNTESVVQYGASPANLGTSVTGTTQIFSDAGYPANYYYHSVQLTGLQANTKYHYRIKTGAQESTVHSFRTLPLPGQPMTAGGHLRFLIMGDNQIKAQPRFDSLVVFAKRNCEQLYGPNINDSLSMILMVGDQVDVGTLDHYEFVHFAKNRYLSGELPIGTIIGNHETYGTLQLGAYENHFFYDKIQYADVPSNSERYYAYQVGPVLIINLNTEATSGSAGLAQYTWLQQVVNKANTDPSVQWIMSFGHRPYQAEQYVGDISTWIRNTAVPFLSTSPKFFMHTGAHHHLYARGQLKETPNYHIISGGTAWDQYWGMSNETDFDDVQKTLSNWPYQIVDFDLNKQSVDVKTYSVGSIYRWHENRLIDEFHRTLNQPAPATPSVTAPADTVQLPFVVNSSAFSSPAGELLNSTQFQIAASSNFVAPVVDKLRDYENYYGSAGAPDTTKDQNLGVDIQQYTVPAGALPNGKHYVRVRHRDRNLEWSGWSAPDSFVVVNSVQGFPSIALDKTQYDLGETITVTYANGPGLATDWVGIYKKGQTPGQVSSTKYQYVNGGNGVLTFTLTEPGEYFAAFFTNDTYTEIADRVTFYHGNIPFLTSDKTAYAEGEAVTISYANAPGLAKDWVGLYKVGMTPGVVGSVQWSYVSGAAGSRTFNNLPKGYYFAAYLLQDQYAEAGERIFFSVGDTIAQLVIDKSIYNLGEYIVATWTDGPGIPKDWLGVYQAWKNPNIDALDQYTYFGGVPEGAITLKDTLVPTVPGNYFVVMFTNDSYNEVSNRCYFTMVEGGSATNSIIDNHGVRIFPNPSGDYTIVESEYPIDKIEVLSQEGRLLYRSTTNAGNQQFTLLNQQLPEGTYVVKVYSRKLFTLKMVVQR